MATVGSAEEVLGHRVVRAMGVGRVPGCAVACVSGGEVVWTVGFGVADETLGRPVSPATTFQVASVSKIVTAWAAMALVADDKITLDSPIVEHLSRWRFDHSQFDPVRITLRGLLTHTAGLPTAASATYTSPDAVPALIDVLAGRTESPAALPLEEPGTRFRYSNLGYAVIENVIEELSGQPFADFARERILEPLGMDASTFDPAGALAPEAAGPHRRRGSPLPRVFFNNRAAGGLVTTPADLATLARGMMITPHRARGEPVLPPDLVEGTWTSPPPAMGAFALRTGGYGMGQVWGTLASGTRFAANQGSRPGWRALLLCLPDRGEAIVAMTNSDSGLMPLGYVAARWLTLVAGEPLALHRIIRPRRHS
jgi:CubicO group peptidase (beta-lactamase class C family)